MGLLAWAAAFRSECGCGVWGGLGLLVRAALEMNLDEHPKARKSPGPIQHRPKTTRETRAEPRPSQPFLAHGRPRPES